MAKKNVPELKTQSLLREDGTTATFAQSSGNIFADLGLEDAAELQFKTQLIFRIQRAIVESRLTQAQAAQRIGIDQPRLSKMLRGEFASFSSDQLFDALNRLGRRVEIRVLDDVPENDARTLLVA